MKTVLHRKNQRQDKKPRKAVVETAPPLDPPNFRTAPIAAEMYANAVVDPKLEAELEKLKEQYDIFEFIEILKVHKAKRSKGRPAIPDKFAVIDAAAEAKARCGRYTQIAPDWNLTPRQLTDLVQHNRPRFERKVKEFRRRPTTQ